MWDDEINIPCFLSFLFFFFFPSCVMSNREWKKSFGRLLMLLSMKICVLESFGRFLKETFECLCVFYGVFGGVE